MAYLINRGKMWYASWTQGGKKLQRSTGILTHPENMTPRQAKIKAQQQADIMEQAAKGTAPVDKLLDAVRSAGELSGACSPIPTVREYFGNIPAVRSESSERNRQRSYSLFLEYLGVSADKRIDAVTYETCRQFVREQLQHVSQKTVTQYRTYIAAAFARAQDIDGYMTRNPMKPVNVPQEAANINPDKGRDKQKRQPFTVQEISYMINNFPAPWCDMVAFSWYTGGLRLSDVCLMKWQDISSREKCIRIIEKKTHHVREIAIIPELQALLDKLDTTTPAGEPYIFPSMAHLYLSGVQSNISTQFTTLLKGAGIIPLVTVAETQGRRKALSPKSFHSIRHTAVSVLRSNPTFTADMVRDAVGHDSEEVERGYYTGNVEQRAALYSALASVVSTPTTSKQYIA